MSAIICDMVNMVVKMINNILQRPEFFALLASIVNGTIGIFNRFAFNDGMSANAIAFYKCFGAFLIVTTICFSKQKTKETTLNLAKSWHKFAILSFFGIFCLYFFETLAFSYISIPLVAFLTYASGVFTIILSVVFLKEKLNIYKISAFALIISGVFFMFLFEHHVSNNLSGIIYALLGGLGYALFIFLAKVFNVGSGLPQLCWLFGFGSLYLLVTFLYEGFSYPTGVALLAIFALILLPTIGGFLFTTKAVQQGEASKVQIIETSDPLFATLFAFLIFSESLTLFGFLGSILIILGLILSIKK